ncbi:MAG: hypothetical protein R3B93_26580 [Bacteroidia bacterium]
MELWRVYSSQPLVVPCFILQLNIRCMGTFSALFCLGLRFTPLQIAANPYVAILGSSETASSRLNLAQGFNSFGTTIAPLIGGYLVFEYFANEGELSADSVKTPCIWSL